MDQARDSASQQFSRTASPKGQEVGCECWLRGRWSVGGGWPGEGLWGVGVGVISEEEAGSCGAVSCGTTAAAAAAAMLGFKCATCILVLVTSFLILATKL